MHGHRLFLLAAALAFMVLAPHWSRAIFGGLPGAASGARDSRGGGTADSALISLVEAERAFSRASEQTGMRSSFLEYFDDSCVVFRPGPVNGKAAMRDRAEPPVILTWEPVAARVSADGLLGYTTGPWTSRPKGKVPGETHYGHYFSVWARQPGGVWKVALDIGTGHDQPGPQAPLALQEDTPVKTASGECPFSRQEAIDTILILETELGNPAELLRRQNLWSALVSDEIRFHRPDKLPFTGGEVVAASLALLIKSISWSPLVVRASESGDFAYTYGSYSFRPGEAEGHPLKEDGFYAHVWVWDPHRGWQLSAIVHSPAG